MKSEIWNNPVSSKKVVDCKWNEIRKVRFSYWVFGKQFFIKLKDETKTYGKQNCKSVVILVDNNLLH